MRYLQSYHRFYHVKSDHIYQYQNQQLVQQQQESLSEPPIKLSELDIRLLSFLCVKFTPINKTLRFIQQNAILAVIHFSSVIIS